MNTKEFTENTIRAAGGTLEAIGHFRQGELHLVDPRGREPRWTGVVTLYSDPTNPHASIELHGVSPDLLEALLRLLDMGPAMAGEALSRVIAEAATYDP
jgi:hypothetical protein